MKRLLTLFISLILLNLGGVTVHAQASVCTSGAQDYSKDEEKAAYAAECAQGYEFGRNDGFKGLVKNLNACPQPGSGAPANVRAASAGCAAGYSVGYTNGRQERFGVIQTTDTSGTAAPVPTGNSKLLEGRDTLIVPIGGVTTLQQGAGEYIKAFYTWGIGLAALLAMAMIVFGAVEYTASAGNVGSRESATNRIKQAIFGLVILLSAVIILNLINPDLQSIGIKREPALSNGGVVGSGGSGSSATPAVDNTTRDRIQRDGLIESETKLRSSADAQKAEGAAAAAEGRLNEQDPGLQQNTAKDRAALADIKAVIDQYVRGEQNAAGNPVDAFEVFQKIKTYYDANMKEINNPNANENISPFPRDVMIASINYMRVRGGIPGDVVYITGMMNENVRTEYLKPDPFGSSRYQTYRQER